MPNDLNDEAYRRLDRKLEIAGIDEPDEEFTQAELREMLAEERAELHRQEEEQYGGW